MAKLIKMNKIEALNVSQNRLENEGVLELIQSLASENQLKTIMVRKCEASSGAWIEADRILNEKEKPLENFYIWGNDFSEQTGAKAIYNLIDTGRFLPDENIDVTPYIVDEKILMAVTEDTALKTDKEFQLCSETYFEDH